MGCTSTDLGISAGIILNICVAVSLILSNKFIYNNEFQFMLTLTTVNFMFTACSMQILKCFGFVQHKEGVTLRDTLPVTVWTVLSIGFAQLNLAFNSVDFYQASKLATIPFVLLVQYVDSGTTVSYKVLLSLLILLVGVGLATGADVSLNLKGSIVACLNVVAAGLSQVFTHRHQETLKLDFLQLLLHTSPGMSVGMALMALFFDDVRTLAHFHFNHTIVFFLVLSSCLAVVLNATNFMILGKTSPITFQVVGHLKTCMVFLMGYVVFKNTVTHKQAVGIAIAVAGVILYSEIKRREKAAAEMTKENRALLDGDVDWETDQADAEALDYPTAGQGTRRRHADRRPNEDEEYGYGAEEEDGGNAGVDVAAAVARALRDDEDERETDVLKQLGVHVDDRDAEHLDDDDYDYADYEHDDVDQHNRKGHTDPYDYH